MLTSLQDKLHKAGDAFFGSKDSHAEEKREAEAQRDREAEAKLAKLQGESLPSAVAVCHS